MKGTVSAVSPHAKMAMPDSQRYPWNIHLISNVEDMNVLGLIIPAVEMRKSILNTIENIQVYQL